MLQGTLTFRFLVRSAVEFAFGIDGRRMRFSGRREDVSSAVFDGGSSSHGFCIRPGTAAYRLRDFAEFGSPRIFAAAWASRHDPTTAVAAGPKNKITHSTTIIAQHCVLVTLVPVHDEICSVA